MQKTIALFLSCLQLLFWTSAYAEETTTPSITGEWSGDFKAGPLTLTMVVHFIETDGVLQATVDFVEQGAFGFAADRISREGNSFTLEFDKLKAVFEGALNPETNEISGLFKQLGISMPISLKQGAPIPPAPLRPQEPKEPFGYRVEEVNFGIDPALAGTLTLPNSEGPFSAVVLIAGSGPNNRDEEILGHKPFLVLADHLTKQGLAVLRYDKRGVQQSTGDYCQATTEDFADDALAAVSFLKSRAEIDPTRIGLIGHSEGGTIAPMAAAKSEDVAFIVLMAGCGVNGEEICFEQSVLMQRAEGATDAAIEADRKLRKVMLDIAKREEDPEEGKKQILDAALKHLAEHPAPESNSGWELTAENAEKVIEYFGKQWRWFRYFLTLDPTIALKQVRVPVLALNGELDLQVSPGQNLPVIAKALEEGGNPDFRIVELPKMNHLFQTCSTGSLLEYAKIEETISPTVLDLISDWILEKTKKDKP